MESPGQGSSKFPVIFLILVASGNALFTQSTPSRQEKRAEESPYILRVTTREVVIDVIAVDGHDRAIADLNAAELRVSEKTDKTSEVPEIHLLSFRLVNPNAARFADLPSNASALEWLPTAETSMSP